MKYYSLLLIFASVTSQASINTTILFTKINGQIIYLRENQKDIEIQGVDYKTTIQKEKCNEFVIKNIQNEIKNLGSKSFSMKDKTFLSVNLFEKVKNISTHSPLGKYLLNFNQKMITFKSEANLACQKN